MRPYPSFASVVQPQHALEDFLGVFGATIATAATPTTTAAATIALFALKSAANYVSRCSASIRFDARLVTRLEKQRRVRGKW